MMHLRLLPLICATFTAAILLSGAPAFAQRTPDTGMLAAGADIGILFPDEILENALTLEGFAEYYLGPRLSVRGLLGWARPGFEPDPRRADDHFRELKLLGNAVYNWEAGVWHPFVTGGVGAYFVREKREGRADPEGETRGGINLGGGVEYFTNARTTIKGEARWDVVSHPTGFVDATGFTLSVGLKRYF
jgi:hypothetical protein